VGEIKKAGGKLKGYHGRKLYQAFEVDGNRYEVVRAFSLTTGPKSASRRVYGLVLLHLCCAKLLLHYSCAVFLNLIASCEPFTVVSLV
jgi:hypothetical protein